ncbi:type 2 isopentenyl-diphosphate Delta-isomerase [Neobacillus sp. SM06]|uniref:type 2 isopentenyl-diphosphate Delta-isomerase n=1 Tax=Neobacillus sp. SM06 TaxID=3422492 RepID=UPI003D274BDF
MSRSDRKWDHIRYAAEEEQKHTKAFADIHFVHQSLPNLSVNDIQFDLKIGELSLSSPIFINAMTGGGGERTYQINKGLAQAANLSGVAMAVGSQMSALKNAKEKYTYEVVREYNPNGIVIANLGSEATVEHAQRAIDMIEANALQLHLNVIQELTMPEGDRDFTGALKRIETIVKNVSVPVIVKEVGFGMSRETVLSLNSAGVTIIDIGGAGGTNFAKIENRRRSQALSFFNDWGIPSAVSIAEVADSAPELAIIGSGGIRSALDAAKAIALGADAVGIAGAFLTILLEQGCEGLLEAINTFHMELALIMTALGTKTVAELQQAPLVIAGKRTIGLNKEGLTQ